MKAHNGILIRHLIFLGLFFCIFTISCSSSSNSQTPVQQETADRISMDASTPPRQGDVDCPESLKATIILEMVSSGMQYIHYFPDLEYPLTVEQLIKRGFLAVIPNDPVNSRAKLEFTEEWTPGGCYVYNDNSKFILVKHMVECDSDFDIDLFESGKTKAGPAGEGISDGRSIRIEQASEPPPPPDEVRVLWNIKDVTDEALLIENIASQIRSIVSHYSLRYPDILYSLDDYLAFIGPKNPDAFMNPYSGLPMRAVPAAFTKGMDTRNAENPALVKSPEIQEYAGNYSEIVTSTQDGATVILFHFYYIDSEGDLTAHGVMGYPRRLWRQGIMNGFGLDYYGD